MTRRWFVLSALGGLAFGLLVLAHSSDFSDSTIGTLVGTAVSITGITRISVPSRRHTHLRLVPSGKSCGRGRSRDRRGFASTMCGRTREGDAQVRWNARTRNELSHTVRPARRGAHIADAPAGAASG
jgi:hypothetical protein